LCCIHVKECVMLSKRIRNLRNRLPQAKAYSF